jgi:hypothetical protein
MRFLFYCGVLLVAAGSVVFGLDWTPAPMPAMPQNTNIVFVPPPPPAPPRVAPTPVVAPAVSQPAPVQSPPSVAPVAVAPKPPVETPRPVVTAPRPKCDIDACARAYRSFDETDCTYNPSFGPRRLCTRGDPEKYARDNPAPAPAATPPAQSAGPGSIIAPEPGAAAAPETSAAPRCNVSACAAAYPRSFREADCTFNPGSGPRRVCEK